MNNFNYTLVNSDFKPENYISIPYVKIPALVVRDLGRVLSTYTLPNLCQPKLNHLLHSLIKHFLVNGEKCNNVIFGEEETYRTRSFNVNQDMLSYLPSEQEELERLVSKLLWNALGLHNTGCLKSILELV